SERLEREKPEQRSNDTERSQPGTDHVIAINSRDVVREGSESEPNAGGGAEKRNSKQQVVRREIKQLPRFPDHSESIEGQTLGQGERGDRRHAEERRAESEYRSEAGTQAILKQPQKAAACAVAEEGDADRHVGEVVPLDDGEEARQQYLVGQRARGNE